MRASAESVGKAASHRSHVVRISSMAGLYVHGIDPTALVRVLDKVKRPAGVFAFDLIDAGEDEHGVWLYGPAGSAWRAPHDTGTLPHDILVLVQPDRWVVTCWADDPADRRVGIDVALPPERTATGWRYVDLELDPVRHADGTVEIEDEDEFDDACAGGWIAPDHAAEAERTAKAYAALLREGVEPWGVVGWKRLEAIQHRT